MYILVEFLLITHHSPMIEDLREYIPIKQTHYHR